MHYIFKATIKCDTDESHPDAPNTKGLTLTDTFNFDADYFNGGTDAMRNYIKKDLALVAGGGYNSDHINNVSFEIEAV